MGLQSFREFTTVFPRIYPFWMLENTEKTHLLLQLNFKVKSCISADYWTKKKSSVKGRFNGWKYFKYLITLLNYLLYCKGGGCLVNYVVKLLFFLLLNLTLQDFYEKISSKVFFSLQPASTTFLHFTNYCFFFIKTFFTFKKDL